ncbi:corrinoid protein [Syntrophaceticus schinkii]|jgi:5-methyltetrahydrofolate--homocysteine methyltransferase|uniref:Dimethylamine corrinoid protein 2 n=1 Tax=Syntrophaceticus schinkii TaxID=499207 RepID=A0A0B7MG12_9FIRM|nr:Dimethylamine corrinoid protein 2 [Syntrophaceticus schinkii]
MLNEVASAVQACDEERVKGAVERALQANAEPLEVIDNGLIAGMNVVGKKFREGDVFVPEVLMAAEAMRAGMEIIKPKLMGKEIPTIGTAIVGTVEGDLHDIGKNLVIMMLEIGGFKVVDLGIDITPDQFVNAAKENNAILVGMSALLTTTMMKMKDTIDALEEAGVRKGVKVIIGGAPVSQDFADDIGADGYAPDAATAAELAKNLVA